MDIFNALKLKHNDIEFEKLDYLPMVDRFMSIIVGNDPDVGLNLLLDENTLKYSYDVAKNNIYQEILVLVGEAFLHRKESKACSKDELSKILSSEIRNAAEQKLLITTDKRIPGLLALIKVYNKTDKKETSNGHKNTETESDNTSTEVHYTDTDDEDTRIDGKMETDGQSEDYKFVPSRKYRPKKSSKEYLCFTLDEAKTFKLAGTSDYEEKIKEVVRDLATLSVYEHPYACALLYRTLLEISTRLVFERHSSSIGHTFNDGNNIEGNMLILNNNFLFTGVGGKDVIKIRNQIKTKLSNEKIVDTLNLYRENPEFCVNVL